MSKPPTRNKLIIPDAPLNVNTVDPATSGVNAPPLLVIRPNKVPVGAASAVIGIAPE